MFARNSKDSFSLVELLIVVIIVGIILSFAVPSYRNSIERSKSKTAEFNLISIFNSEKRYRLDNGNYFPFDPANPGARTEETDIDEINNNLNLEISDPNFTYSVTNPAGGDQFIAEATRTASSVCGGEVMSIADDSAASVDKTACSAW